MRRWNGWGDDLVVYPFPDSARTLLINLIGEGERIKDASLEEVLPGVPASRLSPHPLIRVDAMERLRHARGQSLPDWIALRSGRIDRFPDGVAYPASDEEVREALHLARNAGASVIPYGGGSSVVGHINPERGDRPVLTVDMGRMHDLVALDEMSHLATFGAGVPGPEVEARLKPFGLTLGHYPQSFEYSTLGGWVASRSSGQQSFYYGRIEDLFAGGVLETPKGPLQLAPVPASAAGPDLRHLVLGSEGRLGIITRATVRVRQLPESEVFFAIFFRNWPSAVEAVRTMVQEKIPLSMLRLSDAQETITTLALAGRERLVDIADHGLRLLGYEGERCILIAGATGQKALVSLARHRAGNLSRRFGGLPVGTLIGRMWRKSRFLTPYLRNTLWENGYAIDTLETALPWSNVMDLAEAVKNAIQAGLQDENERVLVFAHLSHVYNDGASVYFTYLFRRSGDPDQTLRRWQILKGAASEAIVALGGTISHQHGVGQDHAPYLKSEKGPIGLEWIKSVIRQADPEGLMNPGKLLEFDG